ncbi:MAG: DNA mismatch repair protein MutS [Candidatus Nitrospinota bacterium M3_3B_026]
MSSRSATPMMRQYWEIKKEHPDAVLFFRMGDFYEMFGEDAVAASKAMNIALTTRDKGSENAVPMCGVPYHALGSYLPKMIEKGHKVAICEQTEDPAKAKGLVRREVVRVITPGSILEPSMLDERSHNFLAAVAASRRGFGLAAADLSTGLLRVCEFAGDAALSELSDELDRTGPKQVLVPAGLEERHPPLAKALAGSYGKALEAVEPWMFGVQTAEKTLLDQFGVVGLDGFGLDGMELSISAAGAAVAYLRDTQKGALAHIRKVVVHNPSENMMLDTATRRNLELTCAILDGARKGSLLDIMDETAAPMGARTLKEWILRPLVHVERIRERLETVRFFYENPRLAEAAVEAMGGMGDLERTASRVSLPSCSPRDLYAMGAALKRLPALGMELKDVETSIGRAWRALWDDMGDVAELLERAIAESPPAFARDGGAIREGYSEQLDDLRAVKTDSRRAILRLEEEERARSGVPNLKIKYNKVYGYFMEVSRRHSENTPEDWMRKQSLVNSERFVSPKLKELEEKIQTAEERALEIELQLFESVKQKAAAEGERAAMMAAVVGEADALLSLARLARRRGYVEPEVDDGGVIEIKGGRHPVIEAASLEERFVPNDALLDRQERLVSIITGPNMAGKSTYIRQVALITLMAQIGSYVPADSARIGVLDRIFTRVGAQDHLQKGQSTFMVEMNETAMILNHATPRSLIILDEIGRGTSTFDGISIAWAVAEYIHKIGARTLFATHYHELTELAESLPGVVNLSVAVKEWNEEIIFLRKIVEGGADKSYGIQVARLAGLPPEVISRAGDIMSQLEANEFDSSGHPKLKAMSAESAGDFQVDLFSPRVSEVEEELKKIDVDNLTPLEALNELAKLRRRV